jgi:hypothetical protein
MNELRYRVQVLRDEKWVTVFQESNRAYCEGYLERVRSEIDLRNEWQLYDTKTNRALLTVTARNEMGLGQIAGWPTAEQYEQAAERALKNAKIIREREAARAARHGS